MEIYFSPLSITDPGITFHEYNTQPRSVTIKAIKYELKKDSVVVSKHIEDVNDSNFVLVMGYFPFLQPYVVYKACVAVYGKQNNKIQTTKLVKILKYTLFELSDKIFYKTEAKLDCDPKMSESSVTTKHTYVYDYVCSEEFQWDNKIELKNNGELEKEFVDIFKLHKTVRKMDLLNNIVKNDELHRVFFNDTFYFKIERSVRLYEFFYRSILTGDKRGNIENMRILDFDESNKIFNYVEELNCALFTMENFVFFNNTTITTIILFIRNLAMYVYDEKIPKNMGEFVLCGLILFTLANNGNADHISVDQLKNEVIKYHETMKDYMKDHIIEDTSKNFLFNIMKERIRSLIISEDFTRILILLIEKGHIFVFTMEDKKQFIYLKSVFNTQKAICEDICAIQNNLVKYSEDVLDKKKVQKAFETRQDELTKDKIINEKQAEFFYRASEYDFAMQMLKGKPGTGKTTGIFHVIQTLLQFGGSNILLTSFQGSTKENLFQKVMLKLFPSENYKSLIGCMTIHKFISKVTSAEKEVEEKTDDVVDQTKMYDLEDSSTENFREFYKRLKIVIIDEFSNINVELFRDFLCKIKDRVVKIILVGDDSQCVSINSIPLMKKMEEFIAIHKSENITELTENNRFDKDIEDHIQSNIDLVYDRSSEIEKKFKYGNDTPVEIDTYNKDLISVCKSKISNHNKNEVEIFTFKNEDVNEINKSILVRGFLNETCSTDAVEFDKRYRNLLRDDYEKDSIVKLGNKILNKRNASSKTLGNCYIFKFDDKTNNGILNWLEYIRHHEIDNHTHNGTYAFKHKNTLSFFSKMEAKLDMNKSPFLLDLEECKSEYIANGTSGYIVDIQYGVQFIPKFDSVKTRERKISGKTYRYIKKSHWASDIKIVTILTNELDSDGNQKKKTIIIGRGCVEEANIHLGFCKTIDSVQGLEFNVGVFIIPEITFVGMNEHFFCINRLLVALSRAKKKLYILVSSNIKINTYLLKKKQDSDKIEWIQSLVNGKEKTYRPLQVIQHIVSNNPLEKKTQIVSLLQACYSKVVMKKKEEETSNKKQKIE